MNEPRLVKSSFYNGFVDPPVKRLMQYPFMRSDAGRSKSKRPKQSNDCTVLALAHCEDLPYDVAYEFLAKLGRKTWKGFHLDKVYLNKSEKYEALSFPAEKGKMRMNVTFFCEQFTEGRYILRTAKHVTCVIDGVLYDCWEQNPVRCVYKAWRLIDDVRS